MSLFYDYKDADTSPSELELDEEGTRISLTIVDTPGFGDQIDNESRFVKIYLHEIGRDL